MVNCSLVLGPRVLLNKRYLGTWILLFVSPSLVFCCCLAWFILIRSHSVAQAGLELKAVSCFSFLNVRLTGMHHHTQS